jgi:urease accessory protein
MTAAPPPLLDLMWLASPALPVGGFSYSEVLEAAVECGAVTNEAQAGAWLLAQLQLVQQRSELPLAAQAHAAWCAHDRPRIEALNHWLLSTRESAELRAMCEQMGRSLLDWLRNGRHAADERIRWLAELTPAPGWPLAHALACALAGASARDALQTQAFGWAENMVQAAMKAVPLGQAAAQRILASLVHAIPPAVDAALSTPDDARQAFAPMLAILSSQHETQYSRLFRS